MIIILENKLNFFFVFLLVSYNAFSQRDNFSFIAHRGGAAHAPENSIEAVKIALLSDVHKIEIDVRMSSDGVLILMHDKKIKRTTNGKGKVKNMTAAELQSFTLKDNGNNSLCKIPALDEVLTIINGQKELVIEVKRSKSNLKGIEKEIAQLIKSHNAYSWCIVHSFCDNVLDEFRKIDTNIRLSKLFVFKPCCLPFIFDSKIRFRTLKYYSFAEEFSVNRLFVSKNLIKRIHKTGKKVNVWTVNNPKKIKRIMSKGADGVITDRLDINYETLLKY